MQTWPGDAFPLGATYDGGGTNVSVYSEVAESVELCLWDPGDPGGTTGDPTEHRVELTEVDGYCWHAYLPGVGPGTRYGFRVHGPWDPAQGLRANPAKLLLDPYAKAIDGEVDWSQACFGYQFGEPDTRNDDDSSDDGDPPTAALHFPAVGQLRAPGDSDGRDRRLPLRARGDRAGLLAREHGRRLRAAAARPVQPRAARGQTRHRLPVLPHDRRERVVRGDPAVAGLHELPHVDLP